jgi:hypothetical protein
MLLYHFVPRLNGDNHHVAQKKYLEEELVEKEEKPCQDGDNLLGNKGLALNMPELRLGWKHAGSKCIEYNLEANLEEEGHLPALIHHLYSKNRHQNCHQKDKTHKKRHNNQKVVQESLEAFHFQMEIFTQFQQTGSFSDDHQDHQSVEKTPLQ